MSSQQTSIMEAGVTDARPMLRALAVLHYLSPAVVLAYYLIAATVSACALHKPKVSRPGPRKVVLWLVSLVLSSYFVEACMLLTDTLTNHAGFSSTDKNVGSEA